MKPIDTSNCHPVGEMLNQIGGKWTMLIINELSDGPLRFSQIKRQVVGISQKVLTATLRELEKDGFLTRTVTPSIPPRVDYELTDLGQDLREPLRVIGKWAIENRPKVLEARRRYLAEHPGAASSRKPRIVHAIMQAAE
jgi:DNA-binding HxlR family transcriptional regulator